MHGDRRPYPVALITLDPEEIVPWAKEHGLPEDLAELAEHDEVHELVQKELDRANANYAQVEQIKKFTILDRDLSIEDGELTPTLKVKRNVINERYADLFDSLYAASSEPGRTPARGSDRARVGIRRVRRSRDSGPGVGGADRVRARARAAGGPARAGGVGPAGRGKLGCERVIAFRPTRTGRASGNRGRRLARAEPG